MPECASLVQQDCLKLSFPPEARTALKLINPGMKFQQSWKGKCRHFFPGCLGRAQRPPDRSQVHVEECVSFQLTERFGVGTGNSDIQTSREDVHVFNSLIPAVVSHGLLVQGSWQTLCPSVFEAFGCMPWTPDTSELSTATSYGAVQPVTPKPSLYL